MMKVIKRRDKKDITHDRESIEKDERKERNELVHSDENIKDIDVK